VELEILAVPLVHSAWLTSAVFGAANLLLLRDRIRREEQALEEEDPVRVSFEGRGNLTQPAARQAPLLYINN
jgi:hypothetical protein